MTRTSRDETFCGICGHLLTRAMIAAEFDGQFIDYVDREALEMSFPICDECRRKLLDIDAGGIEAAKRRTREVVGELVENSSTEVDEK